MLLVEPEESIDVLVGAPLGEPRTERLRIGAEAADVEQRQSSATTRRLSGWIWYA